MRQFLLQIALLLVLFFVAAQQSLAAWGFSQKCGDTNALTCTFAAQPTAGHLIVGVLYQASAGTDINTVSDGGSTYTILTSFPNSGGFRTQVFYTCNYAGNSATITITLVGTSSNPNVAADDYSGNATTGCLDSGTVDTSTRAQSTVANTAVLSNSATTNQAADLLVGMIGTVFGGAITATDDGQGDTYTKRVGNDPEIQDVAVTSSKSYVAKATIASDKWNVHFLAFTSPASGAACSNFIALMGAGCK